MENEYRYSVEECDVPVENRPALHKFLEKRSRWLTWLDTDEQHAIWPALSSIVWAEVRFRTLMRMAIDDPNNALNNTLLGEALIEGHLADQVLAIRRLLDKRSDVVSIRRLFADVKENVALLTRENFVCFDGLPYDYEAVKYRTTPGKAGNRTIWGETTGPNAWPFSERAHEQFDRLAGIDPSQRTREDRLPESLLEKIEIWLDDSDANGIVLWSHKHLAHAADAASRLKAQDVVLNRHKIEKSIKTLARATEGISSSLLYAGGRTNGLMPVAQFNPFEKLDRPVMDRAAIQDAWDDWHRLSGEYNCYLNGVEDELIGSDNKEA